jgi:hypothetical protein
VKALIAALTHLFLQTDDMLQSLFLFLEIASWHVIKTATVLAASAATIFVKILSKKLEWCAFTGLSPEHPRFHIQK